MANLLMRASSVRAILSGTKTVTRRPFSTTNTRAVGVAAVKVAHTFEWTGGRRLRPVEEHLGWRLGRELPRRKLKLLLQRALWGDYRLKSDRWGVWVFERRRKEPSFLLTPRFVVGDVLGVREPWRKRYRGDPVGYLKRPGFTYDADFAEAGGDMRSALYMPARAVRLFLRVKRWRADLEVRRIGYDEARREGFGSAKEFVKAYKAMHGELVPSWAFDFEALRANRKPVHPERSRRR